MKKEWVIRVKTYETPGKPVWKDLKIFSSPGTADEWLTAYLKESKRHYEDFYIREK